MQELKKEVAEIESKGFSLSVGNATALTWIVETEKCTSIFGATQISPIIYARIQQRNYKIQNCQTVK